VRLERLPRAGDRVRPGPSGSPPHELRSWETVQSELGLPGAALRPEGAQAFSADGSQAWLRLAGAWRALAHLGALYGATNDLGHLIALGSEPAFSELMGLVGSSVATFERLANSPIAVGDVVRLAVDNGLSPPRADAMTYARGIVGVALTAAGVGGVARVQHAGVARVRAAAGCVPVPRQPAYLSAVTEGAVHHALSGAVYPRIVGRFVDAGVDGDGRVAVLLDFDDCRDDAAEWLLSDTVLGAPASSVTVPVIRTLWDSLRFEACNVGATGISGAPVYDVVPSGGSGIYVWAPSGMTGNVGQAYTWNMEGATTIEVRDRWVRSGARWVAEVWSVGAAGDFAWKVAHCKSDGPLDSMRLYDSAGQLIFVAGARFVVRGRVRVP
jgi:hypothetical protein